MTHHMQDDYDFQDVHESGYTAGVNADDVKNKEGRAYGAWVSPEDDVYQVIDDCHHLYVARAICVKLFGHAPKHHSAYNVLFRLGYTRVVWMHYDGFNVDSIEYWEKARLSRYQRDLIKDACYTTKRESYSAQKSWY